MYAYISLSVCVCVCGGGGGDEFACLYTCVQCSVMCDFSDVPYWCNVV